MRLLVILQRSYNMLGPTIQLTEYVRYELGGVFE
jgi:hypothetical protein